MNFFLADLPNVLKHLQTLNMIDVYRIAVAAFFGIMCIWMAWSEYKPKYGKRIEVEQDLSDRWG